jgi:membrane-associated phospholipid phosphatase
LIWNKYQNYKHVLILSYYGIIWYLYYFTEKTITPRYFMKSKVDLYIPFVKYMIIPYLFWYVYIFGTLLYLAFTSKDDFLKLSFVMFTGMTLCFILYFIFPNGQNLRPAITTHDLFSRLIYYIYSTDTPTNSAPSIHVLNSIATHAAIIRSKTLRNNKLITLSSLIVMILIIASTVMIKQHSILDVFYGICLSAVLYMFAYHVNALRFLQFPRLMLTHHSKKLLSFFSK